MNDLHKAIEKFVRERLSLSEVINTIRNGLMTILI